MSRTLLIVESPAKARTLDKYLGKDFTVKASVGHIRDLPVKELGVEPENEFAVKYVTIKGKEKVIKELRSAAKNADTILLGPDPDREGEAIAWHLAEALGIKDKPVRRVMFNEITRRAVQEAVAHPLDLDENKFQSQQTRRILDRLVGYKLSPFLWRKVKPGLSAGRVQSVAVRIVMEREEEIRAFTPREYWVITADLAADVPPPFTARLAKVNGQKPDVGNADAAAKVKAALLGGKIVVASIDSKEVSRKAAPPFITSTMQQAASGQLRMSPRQTMAIAQQLYEGVSVGGDGPEGLITYMRTDSVRIAPEAQQAAAEYIRATWGAAYLPDKPNFYKSAKRAQEAHEAIRPTRFDLPPKAVEGKLSPEQMKLYRLVWNRFFASQMAPARFAQKTIEAACGGEYTLAATSTEEVFAGHLAATREGVYEYDRRDSAGDASDTPGRRATDHATAVELPKVKPGDALTCKDVKTEQKFTQPPSRYSEAALIRALEEQGIGRPSTYATIMGTIVEKGYAEKMQGLLRPTPLGEVVTQLLIDAFPSIMEVGFTANMEEQLDEIEDGSRKPNAMLTAFYGPFENLLTSANEHLKDFKLKGQLTDIKCEKCGSPMGIKFGKSGAFLACSKYPDCQNAKNFIRDENGEIVIVKDETTDVTCDKCGKPMVRRQGRFGPYLACTGYPDCKNTVSLKEKKPDPLYEVKKGAEPPCPTCEKPMKLRVSKYGSHFWSCSTYPKCRGTAPFDTGFACPIDGCEGTLIERLPRRGGPNKKPFWACGKCELLLNERPLPIPCPMCKSPWTQETTPPAPGKGPEEMKCPKCEAIFDSPAMPKEGAANKPDTARAASEAGS
ncbi:type I DNA topoisomerase [bacterium]|nr:type I DNA topoisomerase [bacterium]